LPFGGWLFLFMNFPKRLLAGLHPKEGVFIILSFLEWVSMTWVFKLIKNKK